MESTINLKDVIKLLIPLETLQVLKIKKLLQPSVVQTSYNLTGYSLQANAQLKKMAKGKDYSDACLNCKYFPFSIVLKDMTLDFVAENFLNFKYLSQALDHLIGNKKLARALKSRVELAPKD